MLYGFRPGGFEMPEEKSYGIRMTTKGSNVLCSVSITDHVSCYNLTVIRNVRFRLNGIKLLTDILR